jgi:hypothetical protein
MAGFYPDAPDHKIYYNDDGSAVFGQATTGGSVATVSAALANGLNGEANGGAVTMSSTVRIGLVFPQAMDIAGLFVVTNVGVGDTSGIVRTSTDTTMGADGAWTTQTSAFPIVSVNDAAATTKWRTAVQSVSYLGVRGLTVSGNAAGSPFCRAFHIYGRPSSGENPDRLRFWHPTTDTEVLGPHFDYGDVPRSGTATVQFRIKNNSTTKTANTITVADDALTAASPTLASQTTFSADGTSFSATLPIGNLAPGALSAILHARLVLNATAQIGAWRQRFKATAATWT